MHGLIQCLLRIINKCERKFLTVNIKHKGRKFSPGETKRHRHFNIGDAIIIIVKYIMFT